MKPLRVQHPFVSPRHPVGVALRLTAATLLTAAVPLAAQDWAQDGCEEALRWNESQHCEIRNVTLESRQNRLSVDVGPNGAIRVEGWEGSEVRVSARVLTRARNESQAAELAREVQLQARPGSLTADGPRTRGRESWSVSVRIQVPMGTELELRSTNGGITVANTAAGVRAQTTNGGIRLDGVSGEIHARTTNGGIRARVADGFRLREPMTLRTTNGGIELSVPEGLSATVEASTTNGSITTELPLMVQGRVGRRLSGTLGEGGPEIRASTTNGGIRLVRN